MQRSGVVSDCDDAAGRVLAGVWQSSRGSVGFGSQCCVTMCVGVDACRRAFLWMARKRWQVAAVRL
eukprot:6482958-Ditylum_brightwellii.AAC.1